MELLSAGAFALIVVIVLAGFALVRRRRGRARNQIHRDAALGPVRSLAFEDVTALGEDLTALDVEIAGHALDRGATADYQRALDIYEQAKNAGDSVSAPEDVAHLASIIADGRYAIACVRAGWKDSRCRPGVRRASSTRAMGRRSSTSPTSHPAGCSDWCRRAPWTPSDFEPALSRYAHRAGRRITCALLGRRSCVPALRDGVLRC